MDLFVRVGVTVAVLGLVFGMGVHYEMVVDRHWPYPDMEDVATDYTGHIGERILLWGTVESIEDSSAIVRVDSSSGDMMLTVKSFDADVKPGGMVQILGILRQGNEIHAERVVVVNRTDGAELRKYILSAVGGLLLIWEFFRRWRFDWSSLTFRGRE